MGLADFMTDTVTVSFISQGSDAEAAFVQSTSGQVVTPCYIRSVRGDAAVIQMEEGSTATHILYFPLDTGAKFGDLVTFGNRTFSIEGTSDFKCAVDGDPTECYWSLMARELM